MALGFFNDKGSLVLGKCGWHATAVAMQKMGCSCLRSIRWVVPASSLESRPVTMPGAG